MPPMWEPANKGQWVSATIARFDCWKEVRWPTLVTKSLILA